MTMPKSGGVGKKRKTCRYTFIVSPLLKEKTMMSAFLIVSKEKSPNSACFSEKRDFKYRYTICVHLLLILS